MDSPHSTFRFGFWIATTFVIIITVVAVVLAGATPSDKGIFVQYFSLTLELGIISGSCVGLVQAFMLDFSSVRARVRWFSITVVSTTIGWCIIFVFGALLGKWSPDLSIFSDQRIIAVVRGLIIGALIGVTIGLVTGVVQGRIQHLSARECLVGNLISWSIGIGIPLAVFLAILS